MSAVSKLGGLTRILSLVAVAAVLVAATLTLLPGEEKKYVTASFPRTVSLYEGSDVRILGVPVGEVESVTPSGTDVTVKMWYDAQYKVPADAKAIIISPAIVGDRFVQLTPVFQGGDVMADDATIDAESTSTPLELDEIYRSIDDLTVALGPEGANKEGALTRLLDSTARNFAGQGEQFNQTIQDLGKLTGTLENNKEELFGTAQQIQRFVGALARNDQTVRQFNQSLAAAADVLEGERDDLAASLRNLGVAMQEVSGFVRENRSALTENIDGLNRVTKILVKQRDALSEVLDVAPLTLNNLFLTYNPDTGTLDTRANQGEPGARSRPTRPRSCARCSSRPTRAASPARRCGRRSAGRRARPGRPAGQTDREGPRGDRRQVPGRPRGGEVMRRTRTHRTRAGRVAALACVGALALSGCDFSVYDLPLPGGADLGDDPYSVRVQFRDVLDLVPQSAVKVNDVTVGKVDDIEVDGFTAEVTLLLREDVKLPQNALAEIRQTSLLGEKFVSLEAPETGASQDLLSDGELIPLESSGRNPEVEEVLGAMSLLLNGGGVAQLKTIATELNKALDGRESDVKSVLRQLDTFMGQLDRNKQDIVEAIESLNRLAVSINKQRGSIELALDEMPEALASIDRQRDDLVKMLRALDELSAVGTDVIRRSKTATINSLELLDPVLTKLADAGDALPKAFQVFLTYPFVDEVVGRNPVQAANLHMGDYTNLSIQTDIDLTQGLPDVPGLPGAPEIPLPDLVEQCRKTPAKPICDTLEDTGTTCRTCRSPPWRTPT